MSTHIPSLPVIDRNFALERRDPKRMGKAELRRWLRSLRRKLIRLTESALETEARIKKLEREPIPQVSRRASERTKLQHTMKKRAKVLHAISLGVNRQEEPPA